MENLTFYLNFKNDESGEIQITEVVKFDGASFTVEQDKDRYGRDVSFGNEEVSLVFYDGLYDTTVNPLQLPSGSIVYNLTMGLDFLLDYYKRFGFESEVEFIIKKDNVVFTVGILDFQLAKTDQLTYFECKIIQENNRAIIKRRESTNVDVFSDKDLDLNDIDPLGTERILLKAKPLTKISEWKGGIPIASMALSVNQGYPPPVAAPGRVGYFNNAQQVMSYGIEDTLSYLENSLEFISNTEFPLEREKFVFVRALNQLSNITLELKGFRVQNTFTVDNYFSNLIQSPTYIIEGTYDVKYEIVWGYDTLTPLGSISIYEHSFVTNGTDLNIVFDFEQDVTVNIPLLPAGAKIWIYGTGILRRTSDPAPPITASGQPASIRVSALTHDFTLNITAVSTALDSVINGVRYVDLFKQCIKSINGMPLVTPRFDIGGEFYDQFAFNGKLIRQFADKPFYVTFKNLMEGIQEVNADYQINQDNVFMGVYEDFYPNKEIGAFLQAPFDDFETSFNERYAIINLNYKYDTFEQDRDEANTIDGVHTNSQYLFPNKFVEGQKNIKVNHIRDAFAIESARRQGIQTKDTTSLDNDDKMFVIDVVPILPTDQGQFSNILLVQNNTSGQIKILNSDGNSTAVFNWTLLGFRIGDYIQISDNGGAFNSYLVENIEPTVLTVTGVAISDGTHILEFKYPYTGVTFKNRTNEGFTLIENLQSGDNFSNLRYTIRRNLFHWEQYMHTATKYRPNGVIQNTYFKNNGLLKTQFNNGQIYQENEDINENTLRDAIIDPLLYKTKVIIDFETKVGLLQKLQDIEDGKIGGFIRISDTNGRMVKIYLTKDNYVWATGLSDIYGEPKQESEFVEINTIGTDLIEISEVGYDKDIVFPVNYKTIGEKIQLIDVKGVALINLTHFSNIKVNGIVYDNIYDLCNAISEL